MAKRWWDMILAFTGGDLSLLSNLMVFGNRKEEWNEEMKYKQELADAFIEKALEIYLNQIDFGSPNREE